MIAALKARGLWRVANAMPKPHNSDARDSAKRRWEIRDANGVLKAIHKRTDRPDGSKVFSWLTAEGKTSKGEIKTPNLPLYRSERLNELPDGAVIVLTEGEKDADALTARRIPAVATVTGAGLTPEDEALQPLTRFSVTLWPDNDKAGAGHMSRIAARLIALGCEQVQTASWPAAPAKGGAADFRGTDDELRRVLQSARPYEKVPKFGPILVNLANVESKEVEWLWSDRVAVGRLAVLMGDPGVGKSYLSLAVATAVTLGIALPGHEENQPPQDVLILTAEDALADTVRPRLDLLGADVHRVHALTAVRGLDGEERWPSLREHLSDIESALTRGQFGLVIIDPLNAFLGSGVDAFRDNEVRSVLGPLAQLAERQGVAVLCICHITKSRRDQALYRLQGSIAYGGAARTVLLCGRNPDTGERALVGIKSNISGEAPAIAYDIDAMGRFVWLGESSLTKDELLAADTGTRKRIEEAEDFLRAALADGERPGRDIVREARDLDIAPATLRRARERLGVVSRQDRLPGKAGAGPAFWSLKEQDAQRKAVNNLPRSVSKKGPDRPEFEQPDPPDACTIFGAEVAAYAEHREPRCEGHLSDDDGPLVRYAVEQLGLKVVNG